MGNDTKGRKRSQTMGNKSPGSVSVIGTVIQNVHWPISGVQIFIARRQLRKTEFPFAILSFLHAKKGSLGHLHR